jgi:hypothetical protein
MYVKKKSENYTVILSIERSSVPNTQANYMKEQNELYYKTSAAAVLPFLRNSWQDEQTVFTKDITLLHVGKYLITHTRVLLLLQVNDENVEHTSTADVIDLLRKIRGTIGITVLRRSGTNIQVS